MEQQKRALSEEKARRLIVAGTVGAVLLAVILLTVMIYQMISMSIYKKRIENYNDQIAYYKQLIEKGESQKETYALRWWIESEARALGLVFPDDIDLN